MKKLELSSAIGNSGTKKYSLGYVVDYCGGLRSLHFAYVWGLIGFVSESLALEDVFTFYLVYKGISHAWYLQCDLQR
jgi:hypothetical protein